MLIVFFLPISSVCVHIGRTAEVQQWGLIMLAFVMLDLWWYCIVYSLAIILIHSSTFFLHSVFYKTGFINSQLVRLNAWMLLEASENPEDISQKICNVMRRYPTVIFSRANVYRRQPEHEWQHSIGRIVNYCMYTVHLNIPHPQYFSILPPGALVSFSLRLPAF